MYDFFARIFWSAIYMLILLNSFFLAGLYYKYYEKYVDADFDKADRRYQSKTQRALTYFVYLMLVVIFSFSMASQHEFFKNRGVDLIEMFGDQSE